MIPTPTLVRYKAKYQVWYLEFGPSNYALVDWGTGYLRMVFNPQPSEYLT